MDSRFRMFVHYLYLDYREEHHTYDPKTPTLTQRQWFTQYKYFIKRRFKEHVATMNYRDSIKDKVWI